MAEFLGENEKKKEYELFAGACIDAEIILESSPVMSAVASRKALELCVKWIYSIESTLKPIEYREGLQSLLHNNGFPSLMDYKLTMIDGGFPFNKNDQIEYLKEANIHNPVVPVTLEENVIQFHKVLFDADKYKPSATVQRISEEIVKLTGVK